MSKAKYLVILLVVLTITGCASNTRGGGTLTEKNNASTMKMNIGDIVRVHLDGNPTTGYTWDKVAGNESIIARVGETKFEPTSKAIGSGGKVTMFFKAMGSGDTDLKLVYRRTWESAAPAKELTYKINVR